MPEFWHDDESSLPPPSSRPEWEAYRMAVWHSGNLLDRLRVAPRQPRQVDPDPAPAMQQAVSPPSGVQAGVQTGVQRGRAAVAPPPAPQVAPQVASRMAPRVAPRFSVQSQRPQPVPGRYQAVKPVAQNGKVATYAQYLTLLRDPDPTIREVAIEHLERVDDPGCIDSLIEVIRTDEIPAIQYRAFRAVEALGHAWGEADWLDFLTSSSSLVRKHAIIHLQDSGDTAWVPALERVAQTDPIPLLRDQAARAVVALQQRPAPAVPSREPGPNPNSQTQSPSRQSVEQACRCQNIGFISCGGCGFSFNWQDARYCNHCGQSLTIELSRAPLTESGSAPPITASRWPDAILARGSEVVRALEMLVQHRRITEQQLISAIGNRRIARHLSSVLFELRDLLGFDVVVETHEHEGKLFRIP
ncbi:HEAT repeat domain-containing protein [Leptolyngbya sp. FACHB-261]|uniref:HEAT repeat domain-containing protein n=1 Tax=Leptolyngbya sp. FACHB-261 TaxID=2692806 RepID=UPI0016821807|nr:HEAT repeat domain-containing protein [Leptolyngbya sp. FACHB-261]MBD2099322.1 HEAT repeat domain-containing protein [Leptolyngbya sp. FACHB-261]